jgi:hypothetical protein
MLFTDIELFWRTKTQMRQIYLKKTTWEEVARQYNAVNSSGIRTWQQIENIYLLNRHKKEEAKYKLEICTNFERLRNLQ